MNSKKETKNPNFVNSDILYNVGENRTCNWFMLCIATWFSEWFLLFQVLLSRSVERNVLETSLSHPFLSHHLYWYMVLVRGFCCFLSCFLEMSLSLTPLSSCLFVPGFIAWFFLFPFQFSRGV